MRSPSSGRADRVDEEVRRQRDSTRRHGGARRRTKATGYTVPFRHRSRRAFARAVSSAQQRSKAPGASVALSISAVHSIRLAGRLAGDATGVLRRPTRFSLFSSCVTVALRCFVVESVAFVSAVFVSSDKRSADLTSAAHVPRDRPLLGLWWPVTGPVPPGRARVLGVAGAGSRARGLHGRDDLALALHRPVGLRSRIASRRCRDSSRGCTTSAGRRSGWRRSLNPRTRI